MPNRSQFFEYILQFPILIHDQTPWRVLHLSAEKCIANILKPVTISAELVGTSPLSSNVPQTHLTGFGIHVQYEKDTPGLRITDFSKLVFRVASWIRVTCRQFWILSGSHGFSEQYHGTSNRYFENRLEQEHYSVWSGGVVLKPLTLQTWLELEVLINSFEQPPVSDSMFCDALNYFASGNTLQCIVLLGIAAEIEISNLLDEFASASSDINAKVSYSTRKKNHTDNFSWKLKDGSLLFQLSDPMANLGLGGHKWADSLLELYKLRGSAVHAGKLPEFTGSQPGQDPAFSNVARFVFAVEDMYQWADEQRTLNGLQIRRKRWANVEERPIEQINNAILEATSGKYVFRRT
jgi:hypothetical protein